jgi:hypothetical protein
MENKQIIQFELITPFDLQSLETATRAIYGRYCYWQYRGCGCEYKGDLIETDEGKDFSVRPLKHVRSDAISFTNGTYNETAIQCLWQEKDYTAGDIVSIKNSDLSGLKDPPFSWFVCIKSHAANIKLFPGSDDGVYWQKDGCNKTIMACKKRFDNIYNPDTSINNDAFMVNTVLPFGGFPGTDSFRYE